MEPVLSETLKPLAHWCAATVETLGILVITATALYTLALAIYRSVRLQAAAHTFQAVRLRLGRGILLGLEFLIAADIIHTVAVELTFQTVGVLAMIVLIRTFLSFTLEVELTGRWPWQKTSEHGRDKD